MRAALSNLIRIRPERPEDNDAIRTLTEAAFRDAPHSNGTETANGAALRAPGRRHIHDNRLFRIRAVSFQTNLIFHDTAGCYRAGAAMAGDMEPDCGAARQLPSVQGGSSAAEEGAPAPKPFVVHAEDGFAIKGMCWRHSQSSPGVRPVVIINPATSVRCRYYFRFAAFLSGYGFDVIAYDYRGIGGSRPARMRGFNANWIDWGHLDFEAVLRFAQLSFRDQPLAVVGHSAGGFVLGFAKSAHLIRRVVTVGAQYAYWPDYAAGSRLRMLAKWHVAMPLLTMLFGYFPGKRLGWLEDTPKGIVRDWVASRKRFEGTWRRHSLARYRDAQALVRQFSAVHAAMLAISVTDDAFGTVPAVERLLAYFDHSTRTHLRISPASVGETAIGHFGFFNSRFEATLWKIPAAWLKAGRLPADCPGSVITSGGRS